MNANTLRRGVVGPAGNIECAVDEPAMPACGVAFVCHPHPQHGGTMDNKVVQTLARAYLLLGYRCVRFNFRGVGASAGEWGEGVGEIDDALAVIDALRDPAQPFMLAGFSFGAYVASQAAAQMADDVKPRRLVLVGPSTQRQQMPLVPADTLVIHGDKDQTVPFPVSGERTAKMVAGAELKVYEGAPHGLFFTEKDKLTADLLAFIGK